jgi:hypothetical protein
MCLAAVTGNTAITWGWQSVAPMHLDSCDVYGAVRINTPSPSVLSLSAANPVGRPRACFNQRPRSPIPAFHPPRRTCAC